MKKQSTVIPKPTAFTAEAPFMHAGLNIVGLHGDFKGKLIHLVKESE